MERRRMKRDPWYQVGREGTVCSDPGVFVLGCGRGGTTLMQVLLTRHPAFAGGPETAIFTRTVNAERLAEKWPRSVPQIRQMMDESPDIVAFASDLLNDLAKSEGKPRWAEKTPTHVRRLAWLLRRFPEARLIHMIRDGRDVVCSLRHHPRRTIVKGKMVELDTNNPVDASTRRWVGDTSAGLAFRGHPRVMEVRYEDLVSDSEATLRRVCDFLNEPFAPEMLSAPAQAVDERETSRRWPNNANAGGGLNASSVGRWQKDLKPNEREVFVDLAGDLLMALGYADSDGWTAVMDTPVKSDSEDSDRDEPVSPVTTGAAKPSRPLAVERPYAGTPGAGAVVANGETSGSDESAEVTR